MNGPLFTSSSWILRCLLFVPIYYVVLVCILILFVMLYYSVENRYYVHRSLIKGSKSDLGSMMTQSQGKIRIVVEVQGGLST